LASFAAPVYFEMGFRQALSTPTGIKNGRFLLRVSKKERLRQRREEKGINAALNKQMYGNITQGSNEHYEQNR
jgi:hypothetical protein